MSLDDAAVLVGALSESASDAATDADPDASDALLDVAALLSEIADAMAARDRNAFARLCMR